MDIEFRVTIEIDVSGDDPLSAAERAWETLTELYMLHGPDQGVTVSVYALDDPTDPGKEVRLNVHNPPVYE